MTSPGPRLRGFSIIELMVVVSIIAILAMLGRNALIRINQRARGSTVINDCRVFGEAFSRYAQEKGDYPANAAAGKLPAVMKGYVNATKWAGATPLGGRYKWDNIKAKSGLKVSFRAAIRVTGSTWKLADLRKIDAWFDDGNLTAGTLRVTDAGATVIYVVEP